MGKNTHNIPVRFLLVFLLPMCLLSAVMAIEPVLDRGVLTFNIGIPTLINGEKDNFQKGASLWVNDGAILYNMAPNVEIYIAKGGTVHNTGKFCTIYAEAGSVIESASNDVRVFHLGADVKLLGDRNSNQKVDKFNRVIPK